jgi:hypothetical protein
MTRASVAAIASGVIAIGSASAALGAGQFIEDIRVSRRGDEATILLELACPMRFRSDVVTPAGVLVEIRVVPLDACRQLGVGEGIASEVYRPQSGHLAHLLEVEYESLGFGDNLLFLQFDQPVDYRVAQRGDLRTLELRVRVAGGAEAPATTAVQAPQAEPVPPTPAPPAAAPTGRAPLTSRVRTPAVLADYVLNLQSTREPVDPALLAGVPVAGGQHLYVSTTEISGDTWHRLRLGFFADEPAAQATLTGLVESFPRAWVGRAEANEVQAAAELAVERGGIVAESAVTAVAETQAVQTVVAGGPLSPERIVELSAEARAAIVAGDFDTAIRDYSRLLEQPGEHAPEARENLGLAREKNGQIAHAAAEYRRFLADYPQHEAAARVQQRLNGLMTAGSAPRERLRGEQADSSWDFRTGISQYYRRDVNRFDQDQAEITTLSAIFTDVDFSVGQSGTAVDWRGRVTVSHLYDLIGEDGGGPGDRQYISYAFADVAGAQDDWSVRVGRQTLHNWGVLGRFDGAHATYGWSPERRVHVMTGYPVESTRDSIETYRQFIGAAVDFDRLIGEWTVSPFVIEQTIDGISDRQAVGVDMRFFDERRSFTSMLDYDIEYGQLNTALLFGTWRLDNRLTLTAMYDQRASPVLTTRNALIGQPVTTIDELLLVWTEDEIRQIARERTADGRTMTFGVAAPLAQRWQVNADVTMTEIEASVASAGVAAMPGTGVQTYYSTTFVGSALFGASDVSIFNVRIGRADDFTSSQLTWDLRFPVGRKLRLNPRLRLATWESPFTNRSRESIAPSLRLLLNTSRHYRLELEVGNDTLTRTDNGGEQEATGQFIYVGYRADF